MSSAEKPSEVVGRKSSENIDTNNNNDNNPVDGDKFKNLMNKEDTDVAQKGISPMEIYSKDIPRNNKPPTLSVIHNQMKKASKRLASISEGLQDNKLSMNLTKRRMIDNHLNNAANHINAATKDYTDKSIQKPSRGKNPLVRFLDLVNDGQRQLKSAAEEVNKLNSSGESVNAAKLLIVQEKLQRAQQEIDYTSVLVGRAVDSIKQTFNVQL